MFRNVASKAGLVGFALVVGAVGLGACSSSDSGTTTTTGGTTSHAGTGGTSSTAGTTGTTGGTSSTAGTTGTAGSAGASSTGPFACTAPAAATCNSWTTFAQSTTNSFGSGMFVGGITTFGTTLMRDTSTDNIHVTGMVDGYGYGFGLYFQTCVDLHAYTGVSFKLKGTAGTTPMLTFQVQTNPDYPWMPRPMDMKGGCTAMDITNPFGECVAPNKSIPVTATEATVSVLFTDLMGGKPTATADATQVLGIQWGFPWTGMATGNYAFDVTVSDLTLTGGPGGAVSCAMAAGGTGGTGGAGGSGGAATGGGGSGGAAAGSGGTGG